MRRVHTIKPISLSDHFEITQKLGRDRRKLRRSVGGPFHARVTTFQFFGHLSILTLNVSKFEN